MISNGSGRDDSPDEMIHARHRYLALPPSLTTESGGNKAESGTEVYARGKNELQEGMLTK